MSKHKFLLVFFAFFFFHLTLVAQSIDWVSLEEAQAKASQSDKKVMIFAEAEWCGYCKKMYKEVFPKKSVQDSLHKYFYPVRLDIESQEKVIFNGMEFTQQMLTRKFRVTGTPTVIFINAKGEVLGTQPGFMRSEIFDKLLSYVGDELFRKLNFKTYLKQHGVSVNK